MTLKLNGSSSGYTAIDAPASAGSNTLTLPTTNGSANQYLKNSGTAGLLEFATLATSPIKSVTFTESTVKQRYDITGTSWQEMDTSMRTTITPDSASSKLAIFWSCQASIPDSGQGAILAVVDDGSIRTTVAESKSGSDGIDRGSVLSGTSDFAEMFRNSSGGYIFWPGTHFGQYDFSSTSAVTVKIYCRISSGTFEVGDAAPRTQMLIVEYA